MTKMFCDRCDTETKRLNKLQFSSPIEDIMNSITVCTQTVELCDRCLEHIRDDVKPMAKATSRKGGIADGVL